MSLPGLSSIATQPIFPSPMGGASPAAKPGGLGADFGQIVRQAVDTVDQVQQGSALSIQDLLTGKNQDILPVVAEVAKADLSFKLLMGVRNKVIEAYKQTMNMQI
jgi:flagellar hook-basal body complex protein FliE